MIKRTLLLAGVLALLAVYTSGASAQAPASAQDDVLQQIRTEALQKSQVMKFFDQLVTVIGPRLTGSPEYKAAADWSRETLASFGMVDAKLEPFEFGRGWALDKLVIEMVEPRYMPLNGYAEAWSSSTKGELLAAPVFVGNASAADVTAMKGRLAGGIVLSQPIVQNFVREDRVQPTTTNEPVRPGAPAMPRQPNPNQADARQITQIIRDAGPGVLIRTSAGEHGTVFVLGRDQGENAVPSVVLAAEHYNMIARMVAAGLPVKLRVNLQTRFLTSDTKSYNVLAEIPGTDPALKDEVVLLGAHLDSWHTAPGATDNADGTAAAMEAMRILKTIGIKPRRTIRVALWGGEEEGPAWLARSRPGPLRRRGQYRRPRQAGAVFEFGSRHGTDLRLVYGEQRAGQGTLRQVDRAAEGSRRAS